MSNFTFNETDIIGAILVTPRRFGDDRGYFMETYHEQTFADGGIKDKFVQDNQSASVKGVLRGLHLQKNQPQGKLVRVISGSVFDVAVDCRPNSASFGKWFGVTLTAEEGNMFYVPPGCAHGFLVLSERAEFCYKCTDFYAPHDEGGIIFNDTTLGIKWPTDITPLLSDKDKLLPEFASQDFSYYNEI